jgi:hypothetical protein
MGKASRDKGVRGEREVVHVAAEYGLLAERTASLQAGLSGHADVALLSYPEYHVEVKRDERMSVDAMLRQAINDCGTKHPVVAWRRNGGQWYAAMPLGLAFHLIRGTS